MKTHIYLFVIGALLITNFSFLTAQRNCGTVINQTEMDVQDPFYKQRRAVIEEQIKAWKKNPENKNRSQMVVTIPVVMHVIHDGDPVGVSENISDATILAQLQQLNDDFRRMNSDVDSTPVEFLGVAADFEIEFCLATQDPEGDFTTGINRYNYGQSDYNRDYINDIIKPETIWERNSYLNMWSVRFGAPNTDLLGYATFPGGSQLVDGVVNAWFTYGSLANPSGNPPYDKGRTATHEVGHWLSLIHIWGDDEMTGDSCNVPVPDEYPGTDLCDDTPNQGVSNGGCPDYPSASCTASDMFMNYMDYVNDDCMNMFSEDQKTRAVSVINGFRASLQNSPGCDPALVPVSDFTPTDANNIVYCPGTTIQFMDQSTSGPDFWEWTFSGDAIPSPTNSTDENPIISLTTAEGTYTLNVSLKSTNQVGDGNTEMKTYTVDVRCSDDAECAEQTNSNLFVDGSFEMGFAQSPWTISSEYNSTLINEGNPDYDGIWSVLMGAAPEEIAQISQTVTIPAEATQAHLDGWYILFPQGNVDCNLDFFNIYIGGNLEQSIGICDANDANPFTALPTLDLLALGYAGQTVEIMYEVTTGAASNGAIILDDVSLDVVVPLVCVSTAILPEAPGMYVADYSCKDGDDWTHYFTCENELLLSLMLEGTGAVVNPSDVIININADATFLPDQTSFVDNGMGFSVTRRAWNVTPTTPPTSAVGVRHYYNDAEFAQLNTSLTGNGLTALSDETKLIFYKVTSADLPWDYPSLAPNEVIQIVNAVGGSTTTWRSDAAANSAKYGEFEVTSFSGGGVGGQGDEPLPLQWLTFNAQEKNGKAQLAWTTLNEQNTSHFNILRSTDAKMWTNVGWVEAEGHQAGRSNYSFEDGASVSGRIYYKIEQVDLDDRRSFSEIRILSLKRETTIALMPNPTKNEFFIQGLNDDQKVSEISIFDINGKLIYSGNNQISNAPIKVSDWTSGTYFIKIIYDGNVDVQKLVVE